MKHLITGAFLLSAALLTAQETKTTTENKPTVIRVKKVENINGVEKITDTTYTVNGPVKLDDLDELGSGRVKNKESSAKNGKSEKIVIITDEVNGDHVTLVNKGDEMDEQMRNALKAAGIDEKMIKGEDVMVVNTDIKDDGKNGKKKTKIVIVRTAKICDATHEDCKLLGKSMGVTDNKLVVDNMSFYPNPSNGKFILDFNLANKGNTEVRVLNMEGKVVYSETLKDFTGNYKKEIDISTNPKGVYFVNVKQGDHAQLKKVVLE